MRLIDSRRLTGPNLLLDRAGAVLDISFGDIEAELVIGAWKQCVCQLMSELDWAHERVHVRRFHGGASLAISAPLDGLYTATEINEAAWDAARDLIEGSQRHLLLRVARDLRAAYREEERPRLQRLLSAAREHMLPALVDENLLTLGLGCRSQTWDLAELPHPDDVDWQALGKVPVALVTGTNGKTTTVRLLAAIAAAADRIAGVSSTDWLSMGSDVLERDDFAGPGGARRILRDRRCELALLETARGGLLRRGLALDCADVALITNVASDHLGEFGVETLKDLADVKWSVTRALGEGGTLVLNADDSRLMARADDHHGPLCLFSMHPHNAAMRAHVKSGGCAYTVQRGQIRKLGRNTASSLLAVNKVPICFGGAAKHNVANVLAAVAVAEALGLSQDAIVRGLSGFQSSDNPGRANIYRVAGVTVLVDFAHNPDGLKALLPIVQGLPAKRRLLVIGQAGDRSDGDIIDFSDAAAPLRFDRVIIKRMAGLARGRGEAEVATIMRRAFLNQGYPARAIGTAKTELGAARAAVRWANAGDLVVFLSHEKRDATRAFFAQRANGNEDDDKIC